MNVVFMGTPDFAKESLEAIYNSRHNIKAVVTNPDKPKGRGMKLAISPVKEFALLKELPVFQPVKVKENMEFIETLRKIAPDVICVVAYGKILPKEILDIPKFGCINVHGSLLPKYRGAAPIQWAVLNGDKATGITTMYMDIGMDTGDMILQKKVDIGDDETTGELWDRLSRVGGELLVETLDKIEKNEAPRIPQGSDFTMAPMLSKEISKINWDEKTKEEIKNLVRGLNPIMGTYTYLKGKKIKFWRVDILSDGSKEFEENKDVKNGTVVFSDCKQGLYIKAKNGIISVLELQGENGKRMKICEFLRGNLIQEGEVFE